MDELGKQESRKGIVATDQTGIEHGKRRGPKMGLGGSLALPVLRTVATRRG